MNNLLTAITSRVVTGPSDFYSDISGRFYLDQAPEDRQFPDCIFLIVVDVPDNVFNKYGEEISIQFSLFSASSSATEITTMYSDLKSLFDDVKLAVTSNTMVIMKRERLVTFMEDIVTTSGTQRVKVWNIDYTITLQENANGPAALAEYLSQIVTSDGTPPSSFDKAFVGVDNKIKVSINGVEYYINLTQL